MNIHIKTHTVKRSGLLLYLSLGVAAVVAVMALLQLFSYEHFAKALSVLLGNTTQTAVSSMAAFIVICEVIGLAYLLPLSLSKLMRVFSGLCLLVAQLIWFYISFATILHGQAASAAFLGTKLNISLNAGWVVFIGLLIVSIVLVVYSDLRNSKS